MFSLTYYLTCAISSVLLKAITGIIYSGDFFAFLKEALNLRSAYATYKSLGRYMEISRADRIEIDNDFESGVCLGTGCISLMLSLLPGKALNVRSDSDSLRRQSDARCTDHVIIWICWR